MDPLDYRSLPASAGGYSDLFLDYLFSYREVAPFFPGNFREIESYGRIASAVRLSGAARDTLADVLEEENRSFGSPPRSYASIALLRRASTYAVVTGQQVGLFGGPLYTLFKAITAIKLAAYLKTRFPEKDFVPVFWLEGEDHDFAEMNHVGLLSGENAPVRVEYLHGEVAPEKNLGPIGELVLNDALGSTFSALENTLQKSEFTASLLERVRAHYRPGKTFNQAFAGWMGSLLGDQGLVFLSPNHPRLKQLLSPLFEREVRESPKTSQIVIAHSAELEQRYHAQVKAKSLNLFLFHKGGRYLIEPREFDWSLKGTRHFIPKEDLLRMARETPEVFSSNVVLRPLCQDTLLPTVAYVGGPSEIAYYAQLGPVYEHFGVVQPVIYPRASGAFLEERVLRAMDKYGLEVQEFFGDIHRVTAKVVEQIAEVKLEDVFTGTTRQIHDALTELRFGLNEVDPTLIGPMENVIQRIDQNLAVLKEKAFASQRRRNETAVRQVERAANALLPNGTLQERELNILYFMNKYGPDVVGTLIRDLDIHSFGHQILNA